MRVLQPMADGTYVVASPEPATDVIDHPTQTGHTRQHPRWCDRSRCIPTEGAARHSSTTTRLTTGEQTFQLTLVQHDPHGPELLIEVSDTAAPDGLQVLTLHETKALAETLLIEYLKAACLVPAARTPSDSTVEPTRACHAP